MYRRWIYEKWNKIWRELLCLLRIFFSMPHLLLSFFIPLSIYVRKIWQDICIKKGKLLKGLKKKSWWGHENVNQMLSCSLRDGIFWNWSFEVFLRFFFGKLVNRTHIEDYWRWVSDPTNSTKEELILHCIACKYQASTHIKFSTLRRSDKF